ncbi:hypothetical protein ACWEDZ_04195 [Streptomyces sp. NPDC005047]
MVHTTYQGALRANQLNEVRALREFRIGSSGQKVELDAVYSDPQTRLAWIECNTGAWRLPAKLFDWAEVIEEKAREVVGHDEIFPCWAVFEELHGEFVVEIFPEGYKSPFWRR